MEYELLSRSSITVLYFVIMIGAGFSLVVVSRIDNNRFFWSYFLSIGILVLVQQTSWIFNASLAFVLPIYGLIYVFSLFVAYLIRRTNTGATTPYLPFSLKYIFARLTWGPLIIAFGLILYHSWAGPYTEIPSDFWKHLARIQTLIVNAEGNVLRSPLTLTNSGLSWYQVHAIIAQLLSVDSLSLVWPITLVTSLCFLLSTYFFTVTICKPLNLSVIQIQILGFLATLLTFVFFGTATFSYVRYYSFSPAIVAFPLVYFSVILIPYYSKRFTNPATCLFVFTLLLYLSSLIHRQETLFILIIVWLTCTVRAIRIFFTNPRGPRWTHEIYRLGFFVGAITLAGVCFSYYLLNNIDISAWHNTPHIVDAGKYVSLFAGYPLVNPTFRIWDTIGLFGILVTICFFWRFRDVCVIDFFTATMAIPLVTFFNPLYVNIFLRLDQPTVVWRTAYLIPFAIIFSALVVTYVRRLSCRSTKRQVVASLIVVSLTVCSSFPIELFGYSNRTSRLPSIAPIDAVSGSRVWGDVISATLVLQKQYGFRTIISDPITSFVLSAAIEGSIVPFAREEYFPKNNANYKFDFEHSDHSKTMLIVNYRGAERTLSSKLSGHWSDFVLDTKQYYPKNILGYLLTKPGYYTLLWHTKSVAIFSMWGFSSADRTN